MKKILYHFSDQAGLKTLKPLVSSHGRAYVYAIDNYVTGLLFGVRQNDFDFIISLLDSGVPEICECYPGAFAEKYSGKSCSAYEVDAKGFLSGKTSWDPEYVSEHETPVLKETAIADVAAALLAERDKGNIIIRLYEDTKEYRDMIEDHVKDRVKRFHIGDAFMKSDERFVRYFNSFL